MHVLEILNGYPGETFIQEHARAITGEGRIRLSWAFWQVGKTGKLKLPVAGLDSCQGLYNPNRSSRGKKLATKIIHLNRSDAYRRELVRQIARIGPDLIHFQFATLAVQHGEVADALGIPFTFSVRGSDIQTYPAVLPGYLEKLRVVASKCSGVHTVCDHLRETLYRHCGEIGNVKTIRTAIGSAWADVNRRPKTGRLITVGRLAWRKGLSDLLLACKILRERHLHFEVLIIGEGEQRQMLEFMIADLGLEQVVTLIGRKNHAQIAGFFSEADLFVLPSLAEGFPNVVAEAALAKVPVLASRDAMVHEVFIPTDEFIMVDGGNPESIAAGIESYLEMPEPEKSRLVKKAHSRAVDTFSWQQHANQFFDLWSEALLNGANCGKVEQSVNEISLTIADGH